MEDPDTLTPADLSRELGVSQKRIRDVLRAEYGLLDAFTTRWALSDEQADRVRSRFSEAAVARPLADASAAELLRSYAEVLAELRERRIVRTSNAPLGDYAEYLAQRSYGGELAANSAKSYDLLDRSGRRIQVKARTVEPATRPSAVFSVFRSFDFEVAAFLAFSRTSYDLLWAKEMRPAEIEAAARWSKHVNGYLIRIPIVERLGVDVTEQFEAVLDGE
ncbi:DUF6998 domain-containing protein [Agromyces soli]